MRDSKTLQRKRPSGKSLILMILAAAAIVMSNLAMTGFFSLREPAHPLQPDRDSYGFGEVRIDGEWEQIQVKDIFKNLPELPEDFWLYKEDVISGRISSDWLANLPEEYYRQPEFIADTFVVSGLQFWKTPDRAHWYPEGFGTFISFQHVTVSPGSDVCVHAFTHSSWGVENYQGFSVVPQTLDRVTVNDLEIDIENPGEQERYFDFRVEPQNILLGPTYPFFDSGWVQRVRFCFTVDESSPAGTYAVGYDLAAAPGYLNKQWSSEHPGRYTTRGGMGIETAQLQVLVDVVRA